MDIININKYSPTSWCDRMTDYQTGRKVINQVIMGHTSFHTLIKEQQNNYLLLRAHPKCQEARHNRQV